MGEQLNGVICRSVRGTDTGDMWKFECHTGYGHRYWRVN